MSGLSKRKQNIRDTAAGAARTRSLAKLHIAKAQLVQAGKLDDLAYRSILAGVLGELSIRYEGEASSKYLTPAGFKQVFSAFKKLGWEDEWKPRAGQQTRPKGRRKPLNHQPERRYRGTGGENLTDRQAWKIEQQETALGWHENPKRLQGWIKRQLELPEGIAKTVETLTNREASKVITGLMKLTGERPNRGKVRRRKNAKKEG